MTEIADAHSGFVAVMGRPNVGKSTLLNTLLQQKVAAVSPRPQTTRRQQLGILTRPDGQIIFVDTPGVHVPRHRLGEGMNQAARAALMDADLILFLVDASQSPDEEDRLLAGWIIELNLAARCFLTLNKCDLLTPAEIVQRQALYQEMLPTAELCNISAANGSGCQALVERLLARLPAGPAFYPEDQVTDFYEREIASDLIREAALLHLRDEVPHGIAVRIDEYKDRGEDKAYILATVFVERETHKGIVIGQGGAMLKKIGAEARAQIETMTGRGVYLELKVKVQKNWRDDESSLRQFGLLTRPDDK